MRRNAVFGPDTRATLDPISWSGGAVFNPQSGEVPIVNKEKAVARRRRRRRFHVRSKLRGDPERPRLSVFRSHRNLACQVIDDSQGKTLVFASTREEEVRQAAAYGGNKEAAQIVGRRIAERALAAGIQQVRFDRGHYKYHGRVAALADAAREAGLKL